MAAGWESTTVGWEDLVEGWGSAGVVAPPADYFPIPDAAGLRRPRRWRGPAPTYSPRAYAGQTIGPRRSVSSVDLLEMRGVSTRRATFRYELLDQALNPLGTIDVADAPPKVRNDSTRTIKRTLDGFVIDPIAAAGLETLTARIKPVAVLEDGSEWPLGIFLFADASRRLLTVGDELNGSGHDLLFMLDQGADETIRYPRGTNLSAILEDQADAVAFPRVSIDATTASATAPLAWQAGTSRLKVMEEVAQMAGFLSPYVTNDGTLRARALPLTDQPTFDYSPGTRVVADTGLLSDDLLKTPNRFVVIDGAAGDSPIVGTYDLPDASPLSIANRGFTIADVRTLQGLASPAAADAAAAAAALEAGAGYEALAFDAIPDYRHDTFDVIRYVFGDVWRATAWEVELSATALMHHEARRLYA